MLEAMKVFWIFAHPEPRSLNAALRDEGLRALTELGHEYQLSDLYAMDWNPVVDRTDFGPDPAERLLVGNESEQAYRSGALSADILAEQRKVEWADAVVVQFPLWWYGMPAILKGWFDRVFVKGFAFGVTDSGGRVLRYGDGKLAGKRAMVVTTAGGRRSSLGRRGVNGDLDQLLFPLQHGTFWYTGMSVLPPVVVYGADRAGGSDYACSSRELRDRLRSLATAEPIPFRNQHGGDYDEDLVLRPGLGSGRTGLDLHSA
jgi:NAD(P)H dehydrogenase (quinone)